jgi:hypothetical protein
MSTETCSWCAGDPEDGAVHGENVCGGWLPPPREVNLTQAARWVILLRDQGPDGSLSAALGTWCELLGLGTDEEALAVAETMAKADPPVTATVPPF